MTINADGRFEEDTVEDILDAMITDAKDYWSEDLHDEDLAIIRLFYRPIAERLHEAQTDIGLVLDSAQIDFAAGTALDLLTALIGVTRQSAAKATGTVTFSRSTNAPTDYVIPDGTIAQTDASDPIKFETTETVTLSSGTQSVNADVQAIKAGTTGNVGSNAITVMPDPPTGVESVTNSAQTQGGTEEEDDDELRQRAKDELGEGARATAPALVKRVGNVAGVTSATIFVNDTNSDNTGSGGLPDHSFELVVSGGTDSDIAQKILDTKAAGDTSYGGANGTAASASADIGNGQSLTIDFSRPTEVQIYIDATIETDSTFGTQDEVRDAIIDYIGGTYTSGQENPGGLGVSEEVLIGEIEYAIRGIEGVYDVTTLNIGTTASPSGTSDIAISASEVAVADGTDGSITFTENSV